MLAFTVQFGLVVAIDRSYPSCGVSLFILGLSYIALCYHLSKLASQLSAAQLIKYCILVNCVKVDISNALHKHGTHAHTAASTTDTTAHTSYGELENY